MITEKHIRKIWILLAESFPMLVSELSYSFWFFGKLIFVGSYWTSNPAVFSKQKSNFLCTAERARERYFENR